MNKWTVLAVVVLAALIGWKAGLNSGEAERQAIIDNLPETRALMADLAADYLEPTGRDLICEQIFESVRKELNEEYRLEAEEMDEIYNRITGD